MSTRRKRRISLMVIKDMLCFGVGLSIIVRQGWLVAPGDFNLYALMFGGVLVNVPGGSQLWSAIAGSQSRSQERPRRRSSSRYANGSDDDA